jgi:hypothetical protein
MVGLSLFFLFFKYAFEKHIYIRQSLTVSAMERSLFIVQLARWSQGNRFFDDKSWKRKQHKDLLSVIGTSDSNNRNSCLACVFSPKALWFHIQQLTTWICTTQLLTICLCGQSWGKPNRISTKTLCKPMQTRNNDCLKMMPIMCCNNSQ